MKCEICGKEYKGKIGIGVHLHRSHTSEEISKLHMKKLLAPLPVVLAIVILLGTFQCLVKQEAEQMI
jgi:hypothetical protein